MKISINDFCIFLMFSLIHWKLKIELRNNGSSGLYLTRIEPIEWSVTKAKKKEMSKIHFDYGFECESKGNMKIYCDRLNTDNP